MSGVERHNATVDRQLWHGCGNSLSTRGRPGAFLRAIFSAIDDEYRVSGYTGITDPFSEPVLLVFNQRAKLGGEVLVDHGDGFLE